MKKITFLCFCFIAFGAMLFAQQATKPRTGFEDAKVVKDNVVIDIDVKAFMPESGIYKAKSETYSKSGKYRFLLTDKYIKEQSENILNKWLKESK